MSLVTSIPITQLDFLLKINLLVLILINHYAAKNGRMTRRWTLIRDIRRVGFWLCAMIICCGYAQAQTAPTHRKTLLVLSSTGGGGHAAAAKALEQLVGDEYELKVVYPINDLRIWGLPACEQFYNHMLKKGWIRSLNFLVRHVTPPLFRSRQEKTEEIIASYIKAERPDLVLSLIPFINYPASEAARKSEVPFLLVTTDNDLRHWMLDMQKATHPHMKITIGSDFTFTKSLLLAKQVPDACIEMIGLPMRAEFLHKKDRAALCEEWNLEPEQKRVLIMMGGAGGAAAYAYAQRVGAMPLGVHIVVVAGRNEQLKADLEQLPLHPSNLLSIFGYTDRIADLMSISDVLITKPGPGTINEAIAMQVPLLIDNTATSLFWERVNVDWVVQHGIGKKLKKFYELESSLTTYLQDEKAQQALRDAFANTQSSQFHLRIRSLIQELIATSPVKKERDLAIDYSAQRD